MINEAWNWWIGKNYYVEVLLFYYRMYKIESPEKESQNSTHAVGHLGMV